VFKVHFLISTEITFTLVSGGHNRGIVSPPTEGKHVPHFRIATTAASEPRPDPELWAASACYHEGSWWPFWFEWLGVRSGAKVAPPPLGAPDAGLARLEPAPGEYVRH
jgi:polyhydroxyalkanoate synthase